MSDKEPNYDAGDTGQVRKRKSKWELAREQQREELEALVNTAAGAAFLWRLLTECGIYTASSDEAQAMAIHEGKRRIGQWVLAELIDVKEELYTKVRHIGSQRQGE